MPRSAPPQKGKSKVNSPKSPLRPSQRHLRPVRAVTAGNRGGSPGRRPHGAKLEQLIHGRRGLRAHSKVNAKKQALKLTSADNKPSAAKNLQSEGVSQQQSSTPPSPVKSPSRDTATPAPPVTSSGTSALPEVGASPRRTNSLLYTQKLIKDGRKTPNYYRENVLALSSASALSVHSISEFYDIPDERFNTPEQVFQYRGYRKLQKLDEGAFGVVSKAWRYADKSYVAVKEVDLRRKKSKRIEEMKRELFVLQKVYSEHVVRLIEHFIIGQTLVIVMEYCAGSNLTAYLKDKTLNEVEAIGIFKQMATALRVLHKKSIAHRDVKLNNFLLDGSRKNVKIGDFGLSVVAYKPRYGILMAKTYCGTEPYMAPEILRRNSVGMRIYNPMYSDIWSLGICLYAMLTRTFPFKMQTSQQELYNAQQARKWRFPRNMRDLLSEEIKDIIYHMLDPEPHRRITINGVVSHPWLNQATNNYQLSTEMEE